MENKLELLKKAMEVENSAVWLDISIHQKGVRTKKEALEIANELATITGATVTENESGWVEVGDLRTRVTIHHNVSKEDKIHSLEQQLAALKEETV